MLNTRRRKKIQKGRYQRGWNDEDDKSGESKRKIRSLMSQQKETPMMEINLIEFSAHEMK